MALFVNSIGAGFQTKTRASGPSVIRGQIVAPRSERMPAPVTPASSTTGPTGAAKPAASRRQTEPADDRTATKTRELPRGNPAALQTIRQFVIEHDELTGLSVVKFMDRKGDVILQVPPEQYLKIVQMLKEFGGEDLEAASGKNGGTKATGLLLNKKV